MSSPYFIVPAPLSGLGATGAPVQVSYDEWVKNTTRDWLSANPNSTIARQNEMGLQVGTTIAAVGGVTGAFGLFQLATGKTKSGLPLALVGAAGVALGLWQNKRTLDATTDDRGTAAAVGSQPRVGDVSPDLPKVGFLQRATDGVLRTLGLA